jgi:hypothetical protein
MLFFNENRSGAPANRGRTTSVGLVAAAVAVVTLGACDSLLDVDLPGSVVGIDLDDPALAETLVLSVVGDFECGLTDVWWAGQWTEEWLNTSGGRPSALMGFRSGLIDVYADPCNSGTGPIWTLFHQPIQQAVRAKDLITGFDQADVDTDKALLIAEATFYQAYSIQMLAETFCGVPILGSAALSPAAASGEAELLFSEVIASAATGTKADNLKVASYIGRARTKLYQGDLLGVIADASHASITPGFMYEATYDAVPARRENRFFERNNEDEGAIPHRDYIGLTIRADGELTIVDGADDPRVPISYPVDVKEPNGELDMRIQEKYSGLASSIPFSTWREAQLMVAEADPAQSVARINVLRLSSAGLASDLDTSAWPLAIYTDGGAVANATTVREERRRELWLQGHQAGDKIRWSAAGLLSPGDPNAAKNFNDGGLEFEDKNEFGSAISAGGCLPIPFIEVSANDNVTSSGR